MKITHLHHGEYVFTASNFERSDDFVKMSGVVQLNGWLGFTDAVTLSGDLAEDYDITMKYGKTYMQYTDTQIGGLSDYFAQKGYTSHLPVNGEVTLYNDVSVKGSSDDYPVQNIPVYALSVTDLMDLETADLAIYSFRISGSIINISHKAHIVRIVFCIFTIFFKKLLSVIDPSFICQITNNVNISPFIFLIFRYTSLRSSV